jgi:SAM-dependent methyltransferase
MNRNVLNFAREHLDDVDVRGKRILEVGSYNINGTIRDVIEPMEPAEYVGVDIKQGPCVDEICDICMLVQRFGEESFDFVVTCSVLSHIEDWRQAISNMKRVCKCGGVIFVVTSARWEYRTYGNDYHDFWRYTKADLTTIFSDFEVESLHTDSPRQSLIYLVARKPELFTERDLTKVEIPAAKDQRWGRAYYEQSHPPL